MSDKAELWRSRVASFAGLSAYAVDQFRLRLLGFGGLAMPASGD
jgi:hypothetical protein